MAANVNNYVAAGRAAVNANTKIRTAYAKGKPQVDKIANAAITANAREKAQSFENNAARLKRRWVKCQYEECRPKIEADKNIYNTKKARMAGMLAGGAALIGVGAMQMNKKEEENEMLGMYKDFADKYLTLVRLMERSKRLNLSWTAWKVRVLMPLNYWRHCWTEHWSTTDSRYRV